MKEELGFQELENKIDIDDMEKIIGSQKEKKRKEQKKGERKRLNRWRKIPFLERSWWFNWQEIWDCKDQDKTEQFGQEKPSHWYKEGRGNKIQEELN